MKHKTGRYSGYIRTISYILDLIAINLFTYLILPNDLFSPYFAIFISISWLLIAVNVGYYEVYIYTKTLSVFNKIFKQCGLFIILCYSFLGFYYKNSDPQVTFQYIITSLSTVAILKIIMFYALKKYRVFFGGNHRRVVIIGNGKSVKELSDFFVENADFGYKLIKVFDFETDKTNSIEFCFSEVLNNQIDEIYVSLHELSKENIDRFIDFSDNYLKTVKFLPEGDEIFATNLKLDYYGYVQVLTLQRTSLHDPTTEIFKRVFDIFFSLFVIVFFLSWLTPILAFLIKIDSKGSVFFKQSRPGLDEKEFYCFKFRSMRLNTRTETEASRNDPRVTRIGRFMRKRSLDEMPQFFNVLLGDMSVVGPRPHLWSQNITYGNKVKRYMVRHHVKPGITGLAQVRGFRGEIETDEDMINRIKYDVFYIENWSMILDFKIIVQTVINIFKGEEKAY